MMVQVSCGRKACQCRQLGRASICAADADLADEGDELGKFPTAYRPGDCGRDEVIDVAKGRGVLGNPPRRFGPRRRFPWSPWPGEALNLRLTRTQQCLSCGG